MRLDQPPANGHVTTPTDISDAAKPADEAAAVKARCEKLGIEWSDESIETDAEAAALIEADVAVRLRVVPIRIDDDRLVIAMADPLDITAADEAATLAGMPVTRIGVHHKAFGDMMRERYGTTAARMAESLAGEADDAEVEHNLDAIEADEKLTTTHKPALMEIYTSFIASDQEGT